MADVGLYVDHDRPVGHVGKGRKTFMRNVRYPRTVESDARVYDCRIIRQRSHALPDLRHRQTEQVDELELACECGDFLPVMAAYGLTLPWIADQGDPPQVRHQHSRSRHGAAERPLVKRSGHAGRKIESFACFFVDPGKYDGYPGPKLPP